MKKSIQRWIALGSALVTLGAASAALAPSAMAISSDYCGYARASGDPFCFEGSGYRGWRYHQSSTGSQGPLVYVCARGYGNNGVYRVNGCSSGPSNFFAQGYCNADPSTNSSAGWAVGGGTVVIYGHADSRLCGAAAANSSAFPTGLRERFEDPATSSQAGVSPDTARAVGSGAGSTVFALAGANQRCLVRSDADGYGIGCTTAKQLAADGGQQLISEALPEGGYRVSGLFGDGAQKASVTGADGSTQSVALSGSGAGVAVLKSAPTSVAVTRPSGTTSQALPAS